jgi:hypothetical protein
MMKMRLTLLLTALLLLTTSVFAPSVAESKSARKVSHSYDRVWPTAVRFLRVDEGLKITEKDADSGYVLFELADDGKVFTGSVEVVRRVDNERRESVELILQIHKRPSYMEHAILDRLLDKIRDELGSPKAPPKKAPPKEEAPKKDAPDKAPSAGSSV